MARYIWSHNVDGLITDSSAHPHPDGLYKLLTEHSLSHSFRDWTARFSTSRHRSSLVHDEENGRAGYSVTGHSGTGKRGGAERFEPDTDLYAEMAEMQDTWLSSLFSN